MNSILMPRPGSPLLYSHEMTPSVAYTTAVLKSIVRKSLGSTKHGSRPAEVEVNTRRVCHDIRQPWQEQHSRPSQAKAPSKSPRSRPPRPSASRAVERLLLEYTDRVELATSLNEESANQTLCATALPCSCGRPPSPTLLARTHTHQKKRNLTKSLPSCLT